MRGILRPLVAALVWATIAEFLLLRTFLRLGPALPIKEELLPVYRAVETTGLAAMNLATLLAAAVAVSLSAALLAQRRPIAAIGGSLVLAATFTNGSLALLLLVLPAATVVTLQAGSTLLALLAVYAGWGRHRRGALAIGLILAACTLALASNLVQQLAQLGTKLPGAGGLILVAETAAVAAAILLPWSFRPRVRWTDAAAGIALGIACLIGYALRPWLLASITMWNLAFSLSLPSIVYPAALGALAATLLALRREGRAGRAAACGILLVALAGLKLDFSYFGLLALAGFVLACQPVPDTAPEASAGPSRPGEASASPGVSPPPRGFGLRAGMALDD